MTPPGTSAGDYQVALMLPDGSAPPPLLKFLPGRPPLYVAATGFYAAPPVGRLTPNKPTLIPAAAIETRDEILLGALRDGLTFLSSAFGSDQPDNWLWGILHQVRLQHFVGQAGFDIFDLGPFAAPGGRFTVNPASYSLNADSFTFSGGPSERFVAVLDPAGIRARNALPGGNNGDPGGMVQERYNTINPELHYGDLLGGWINGETFAYRTTPADIAAHAERKVRFTP